MAAPRARPAQTRNGGRGRRNRLKVTSCRAHLLPSPIAATPIPVPPLPLHRTTSHARYPTPLPDTCPPLNPQPSTPTQNPKSIPIARQWTNGRAAAAAVLDTTKARRGYCEVTAAKGDCSRAAPGGKSRYSPSAHAPVRIWSEARLCWRAPAAQWRGRAMLRPPHAHVHVHVGSAAATCGWWCDASVPRPGDLLGYWNGVADLTQCVERCRGCALTLTLTLPPPPSPSPSPSPNPNPSPNLHQVHTATTFPSPGPTTSARGSRTAGCR